MSTSPALVSIGEPLIEFNRPREGDGRTWLQGFGGDSQNVAIAAARQGASAGYITSLGQDWMGDAFLELTADMEGERTWHFVFGRSDVNNRPSCCTTTHALPRGSSSWSTMTGPGSSTARIRTCTNASCCASWVKTAPGPHRRL